MYVIERKSRILINSQCEYLIMYISICIEKIAWKNKLVKTFWRANLAEVTKNVNAYIH